MVALSASTISSSRQIGQRYTTPVRGIGSISECRMTLRQAGQLNAMGAISAYTGLGRTFFRRHGLGNPLRDRHGDLFKVSRPLSVGFHFHRSKVQTLPGYG